MTIGVSRGSDFYLCGPFIPAEYARWAAKLGVLAENVHTEIFGTLEAITPGMAEVAHTPHLPQGPPGSGPPVSFAVARLPPPGIRNPEICLNWRKPATFLSMVLPGWSLSYMYDWSDWRIDYL